MYVLPLIPCNVLQSEIQKIYLCLPLFSVSPMREHGLLLTGNLVIISHFTLQKELEVPNARNQNVQDGPTIVNGNFSGQTWKF